MRRSPQAARNERLAAALRANLKRRKMQARNRQAEGEKPAGAREASGADREKPGT